MNQEEVAGSIGTVNPANNYKRLTTGQPVEKKEQLLAEEARRAEVLRSLT